MVRACHAGPNATAWNNRNFFASTNAMNERSLSLWLQTAEAEVDLAWITRSGELYASPEVKRQELLAGVAATEVEASAAVAFETAE